MKFSHWRQVHTTSSLTVFLDLPLASTTKEERLSMLLTLVTLFEVLVAEKVAKIGYKFKNCSPADNEEEDS